VAGRGGGGGGGGPGELEILDPETGEALGGAPGAAAERPPVRSLRVRRLRRLRLALVAMSVVSAVTAGYFGFTILSLRTIEHEWAEAMALDAARQQADNVVITTMDTVGDPDDLQPLLDALGRIGDETSAGLQVHENSLRRRWIPDGKIDAVRDDMTAALQFRRFQLAPTRKLLGETPLLRVEAELDDQFDRFGLERSYVQAPQLSSTAVAVRNLRRYADSPTHTVLVALDEGGDLQTVDVDASRTTTRHLGVSAAGTLVAAGDEVVVLDGGEAIAYDLRSKDAERPPAWRVSAEGVLGAAPGDEVAVWVVVGDRVNGLRKDGSVVDGRGATLPSGGVAFGATRRGLVVGRRGGLDLIDDHTGAVVEALGGPDDRFVGATADWVAVQPPGRPRLVLHDLRNGTSREVQLPGRGAAGFVQSPDGDSLAFLALPISGGAAPILRVTASGNLLAISGPRGAVEPGSLAWSSDGEHLFWVTLEGRIGVATVGTSAGTTLRTSLPRLRSLVAFPA
jgi:hypothetical protein